MRDQVEDLAGGCRPVRKELQGPRPTPLKVRKDSHKIKKPPVGPPIDPPINHQQPPQQPVIIYAVSPKVIHANPSEFMTLVQRLTGPDPDHSTSSSSSSFHHVIGAVSPAARLASIDNTRRPLEAEKLLGLPPSGVIQGVGQELGLDADHIVQGVERTVIFPGILSPGPTSIPPISPNFFSPLFGDPIINLNSLHQESTTVRSLSRSFTERNYMPSPLAANFFSPNTMISPSSLDFLRQVLNS